MSGSSGTKREFNITGDAARMADRGCVEDQPQKAAPNKRNSNLLASATDATGLRHSRGPMLREKDAFGVRVTHQLNCRFQKLLISNANCVGSFYAKSLVC